MGRGDMALELGSEVCNILAGMAVYHLGDIGLGLKEVSGIHIFRRQLEGIELVDSRYIG